MPSATTTNIFGILLRRLCAAVFHAFLLLWGLITCRCLASRRSRIGELPTFVESRSATATINQQQQQQNQFFNASSPSPNADGVADWSNWSSEKAGAAIVSDQIEEYRRQKQEQLLAAKAAAAAQSRRQGHPARGSAHAVPDGQQNAQKTAAESDDLFAELQPKVKAPKKLLLRPKPSNEQRRDLFQVRCDTETDTDYNDTGADPDLLANSPLTEFGELSDVVPQDPCSGRERTTTNWRSEERRVGKECRN